MNWQVNMIDKPPHAKILLTEQDAVEIVNQTGLEQADINYKSLTDELNESYQVYLDKIWVDDTKTPKQSLKYFEKLQTDLNVFVERFTGECEADLPSLVQKYSDLGLILRSRGNSLPNVLESLFDLRASFEQKIGMLNTASNEREILKKQKDKYIRPTPKEWFKGHEIPRIYEAYLAKWKPQNWDLKEPHGSAIQFGLMVCKKFEISATAPSIESAPRNYNKKVKKRPVFKCSK